MIESWRYFLYPIGFIASLGFTLRFVIQWLQSEKLKKSHVTHLFWSISLVASFIMMIHAFIQIQFFICLFQGINCFIAWRNINLKSKRPKTFFFSIFILFFLILSVIALFTIQSFCINDFNWIQSPKSPFNDQKKTIGFWWNLFGNLGLAAFASRFWLQWWLSEKKNYSHISFSFWLLSLIGAILSLAYFIHIFDLVNIAGYGFGIIPYLRNLIFLKKEKLYKNVPSSS